MFISLNRLRERERLLFRWIQLETAFCGTVCNLPFQFVVLVVFLLESLTTHPIWVSQPPGFGDDVFCPQLWRILCF